MKKLTALLALSALASTTSACVVRQAQYVTLTYAHSASNTVFIAYTEYPANQSHMIACTVQADNTPACRPQPALDRLLNAQAQ
jgi:hypothetical protein